MQSHSCSCSTLLKLSCRKEGTRCRCRDSSRDSVGSGHQRHLGPELGHLGQEGRSVGHDRVDSLAILGRRHV